MAMAVVVKQLVAAERVADVPGVAQAEAVGRSVRVVDEEHVEVPVVVVVEERSLRRVAFFGEPVLGRHLLEAGDALLVDTLIDV